MRLLALSVVLCLASAGGASAADGHSVPNPRLTPGQAQPDLTRTEICADGFGKAMHMIPDELQRQIFAAYGLPEGNHTGYCDSAEGCAIDRLIPSSLGGSNDPRNLWPLPYDNRVWNVAAKKQLEKTLRDLVCRGEMSLADAQSAVATDWITAYQTLVGEPPAAGRR